MQVENSNINSVHQLNLLEISDLIQQFIDLNTKSVTPTDDIDFDDIMKTQNLLTYVNDEIELNHLQCKIEEKINNFQMFIQNFHNIELIFYSLRNYYMSLKMKPQENEVSNEPTTPENLQPQPEVGLFDPRDYEKQPKFISKEIPENADLYGSQFIKG
jgi:hypothetical protein